MSLRYIRYLNPTTQQIVYDARDLHESAGIRAGKDQWGQQRHNTIQQLIDEKKIVAYYDWYRGEIARIGGLKRLILTPLRSAKVASTKKRRKKYEASMYQSDMRTVESIFEQHILLFMRRKLPEIVRKESKIEFNYIYPYRRYSSAYNKTVVTISERLANTLWAFENEKGYKQLLKGIKDEIATRSFIKRKNVFLKHRDDNVQTMGKFLASIKPKRSSK